MIAGLALAAASWVIWIELRETQPSAIIATLKAASPWMIALASACTLTSHACLAAVEWRAWRLIGRPQPLIDTAWRSFTANALSSLAGLGPASGTALRIKLYASTSASPAQIARLVVLYTAATYLAGIVSLGLSIAGAAGPISTATHAPAWATALVATGMMAPAALWFVLFRKPRSGRVPPGTTDRLAALGAGIGDWIFSGAALFVLTTAAPSSFPAFLAVFCLGSLLGGLAGVPGGVGVLEATVMGLHVGSLPHATVAALILYRAIYLLGPAVIAVVGLIGRRAVKLFLQGDA